MSRNTRLLAALGILASCALGPTEGSADTTPDPFSFPLRAGVGPWETTSAQATIVGIDEPAVVRLAASDSPRPGFSIDCDKPLGSSPFAGFPFYVDAPVTIRNGQVVCVFHDARPCWGCSTYTEVEVGGVLARFESTTALDREPDAIVPTVKLLTAPGSIVNFDPVTITGIDTPVEVSIRSLLRFPPGGGPADSSFSIGCTGTYTYAPSLAQPGDTLCVRQTAALLPNTVTATLLSIGAGTAARGAAYIVPFSASTGSAIDAVPYGFVFPSVFGVRRAREANGCAWIDGLDAPARVSVVGGWTFDGLATPVSVAPGETSHVCAGHFSAPTFDATTTTTVDVGGVQATFTSRTTRRSALTSGALHDFNGDAREDLLWRNDSTGEVALWLLWGIPFDPANPFVAGRTLLAGHPEWSPVHIGDFDGDTVSDIIWRNSATGETAIWLMSDGQFREGAIVMGNAAWTATHVGDFDGDGTTDIVWTNASTGATAVWLMQGLAFHAGGMLLTHPDWRVQHVGDLDGDGKFDLIWRNELTGATAAWLMDGLVMRSGAVLAALADWNVRAVGDFDGDGATDLAWYNAALDQTAIWLMQGTAMKAGAILPSIFRPPSAPVAAADFDADGKSDLVIDVTSVGVTAVFKMDGVQVVTSPSLVYQFYPDRVFRKTMDFEGRGMAEVIARAASGIPPGYFVGYPSQPMLSDPSWRPF